MVLQYVKLLPPILDVFRKMYCTCTNSNIGDLTEEVIPYNYGRLDKALKQKDNKWINAVLVKMGTMSPSNKVKEVTLTPFGPSTGFYSELGLLKVVYEDENDPLKPPTDCIVKFLPVGLEKRLVLDLVELPKSEVLCYFYLCRDHEKYGMSPLPLPTPRILYADYCQQTNNAMMIMEKINHTLGDQKLPADLDQAKALMVCLGRLHAHYWGGKKGKHPKAKLLNDPANPICLIVGLKMKLLIKKMLKFLKKENDYEPSDVIVNALSSLIPTNIQAIFNYCIDHPLNTICHGDPRTDNVYFIDNPEGSALKYEAGLFDWAQAMIAPCFYDVSWAISQSYDREFCTEHHDSLVGLYWETLQESLTANFGAKAAAKAHYEDFLVGYAVCEAICISKCTLAFESIMKDKKSKDYPHKLKLVMDGLENCLRAMEKLHAVESITKVVNGESPTTEQVRRDRKRSISIRAMPAGFNPASSSSAKVVPV
ncbi:hypothetical protein TrVE_jg4774 [Triparma verrucosa]|uniref:CHK kinase-like domain-containing protein n=1 Tax=Triparma verrucosa TaxID=1606542 RepID=A0A9W7BFP3_9STRA|nr:hypothetical protein TrVE_jg4774 [Triparma verrucosa]